MKGSSYATPAAFRRALEDRLRERAEATGEDLSRLQRLVAFDRVLARLFVPGESSRWVVKGGFGLEVRYRMAARTTRDLDLSVVNETLTRAAGQAPIPSLWDGLQAAMESELGDGFSIAVGSAGRENAAGDRASVRFPVEVRSAGRVFARFHLDVGLGDVPATAMEWVTGEEMLRFAGIPPVRFAIVRVERQMAEKLHALTKPRGRAANTRVKDLVDLVLLLDRGQPDTITVRAAVLATFRQHQTHAIPEALQAPPDGWAAPYAALARDADVTARTVEEAFARVSQFWRTMDLGKP